MGAVSVEGFRESQDNSIHGMRKVANDIVADERFEYGSDPYSGSFATINNFYMYGNPTTPILVGSEQWKNTVDKVYSTVGKRCAYGIYAIMPEETSTVLKTTTTITTKILVDELKKHSMNRYTKGQFINDVFTQELKKKYPEKTHKNGTVYSYSIHNMNNLHMEDVRGMWETDPHQGEKKITKFFIIPESDYSAIHWEEGFSSQAEARKHLPTGIDIDCPCYEIVSLSRRESGAGLVTHTYQGAGQKYITSKATISILKKVSTPGEAGWYFIGWAAC